MYSTSHLFIDFIVFSYLLAIDYVLCLFGRNMKWFHIYISIFIC